MSAQDLTEAGLLNELAKKYEAHDTRNFRVLDFLAAFGSPLDAHAYLRLFRPTFIQFHGMTFRADSIEDGEDRNRILSALERYEGNRQKTEQSFNLLEIPSGAFSRHETESSERLNRQLAEALAELWSMQLVAQYSGEAFVVRVVPPEETGGQVGIVFHTKVDPK